MMKMVPRATDAPYFVTNSQNFHIEFLKIVIDLKNSEISDIQAKIISKRDISGIQGRAGAAL